MRIHTQSGVLLADQPYPVIGMGATPQQTTALIGTVASAIPVAGPFIAAAAQVAIAVESLFAGCGQTCIEATKIADQAAAQLQQLEKQYWDAPVHTQSMQQAFIQAFNQIVGYVQQNCGNPALGAAGQRCISERIVRGGSAPWCPTGTGCDWYTVHLDPIANDPTVVPDSVAAQLEQATTSGNAVTMLGSNSPSTSPLSNIPTPLLLGAGGLALYLLMGRKN